MLFIGRIACYVGGKATQQIVEKTSRSAKLLFEHSLACESGVVLSKNPFFFGEILWEMKNQL